MVLIDENLSPNHRAIFARRLDSQLRFAPQVIAGLSPRKRRHILVGRTSLPTGNARALDSGRVQFPKSE
jgi:hypothetical protein